MFLIHHKNVRYSNANVLLYCISQMKLFLALTMVQTTNNFVKNYPYAGASNGDSFHAYPTKFN